MVLAGAGVGGVGGGAGDGGGAAAGVSGASGDAVSCESGRRLGPAVQTGRRGGGGGWTTGETALGSELAAMVGVIDPQLGLLALAATGADSVGVLPGAPSLAGIAVVAAGGGTLTAG